MKSIRESAEEATTNKTGVVSELNKFDINMELHTFEGADFEYQYVEQEGKKYRVPKSVLLQIKDLLEDDPKLTHVRVKQSGSGMDTRYMVLPA